MLSCCSDAVVLMLQCCCTADAVVVLVWDNAAVGTHPESSFFSQLVANQNSSGYMWCTCKEYTCISLNVFDCRPNSNKLCLLAVKNSASFNKKDSSMNVI